MSGKSKNRAWLIPVIATLFVIVFALFTRLMVGTEDVRPIDYGATPFVPGESPYSTGPESR